MRGFLGPAALRPRKKNRGRPEWKVADAFRQWLRGRPCACQGRNPDCGGPMRSAHVDYAGSKGIGTKVADSDCIPLTDNCHRLQHNKGWRWFDEQILGGPGRGLMMAQAYWQAWPGRSAWEKQLESGNA